MKLKAQAVPYSGIVGGGVMLLNEKGAAALQLVILGTTRGVTREQTAAISSRLVELINEHGIEVPEGEPDALTKEQAEDLTRRAT